MNGEITCYGCTCNWCLSKGTLERACTCYTSDTPIDDVTYTGEEIEIDL